MNRLKAIFLSGLLSLIFLAGLPVGQSAPPVFPVSELKAGMTGIGKTVVQGTTIEKFDVEILGILKQQGPAGDLILVRVSGPLIDKTGGIAQGMSGSPVFVDGKLVGAVAYGWGFADARLGLLTPAADMINLWNLPKSPLPPRKTISLDQWEVMMNPLELEEERAKEILQVIPTKKKEDQGSEEENQSSAKDSNEEVILEAAHEKVTTQLPEVTLPKEGMRPISTPIMVSGLTPRAMEMLKKELSPYNLVPYESGGGWGDDYGALETGGSVGVQLVRGDVSMGAIGTVTWVEDNQVIAFGHPFMQKGQTNYYMTNVSIQGVIPSLQSAFKLGTIGTPVGRVDQDRSAGISGLIGTFPSVTATNVKVRDLSEAREKTLNLQVIQDERLQSSLIPVSVYSGIDKVLDREGGGTARVQMKIKAEGLPGGEITRENFFYSSERVSEVSIAELSDFLHLLAFNPFEKVQIDEVDVVVDITNERQVAKVIQARTTKDRVKPGETIGVEIQIQPFRKPRYVERMTYQIPPDAAPGPWVLIVRGGASRGYLDNLPPEVIGQMITFAETKWLIPTNLDELTRTYLDLDRNQELILESYPLPLKRNPEYDWSLPKNTDLPEETTKQEAAGDLISVKQGETPILTNPNKTRKEMPWIMDGDFEILLEVKK